MYSNTRGKIRMKATAKTRYSQFDAKEMGEFIQKQYGFQETVDCRFFDNGMNDIYKVVVGDVTYYYRVSLAGIHDKRDYEEEVFAILAFAEAGIRVAKPIRMVNHEYISELIAPEGIRYGVLFEEAIEIPSKDDEENKYGGMKLLGEYLARIHQYADLHFKKGDGKLHGDEEKCIVSRADIDMTALRDVPLERLAAYRRDGFISQEDYEYLCSESQKLVEIIQKRIERCEPVFGFCHGDLHRGNVRFHQNKPTIFDFDCMGYGYRAYDICIYAWNESFHNHEYLRSDEWKSFLEGYEAIRKLTESEKECIPAFMALRQVWLMGLHADVMNRNAGCCWFQKDYFMNQIEVFRRYVKLVGK